MVSANSNSISIENFQLAMYCTLFSSEALHLFCASYWKQKYLGWRQSNKSKLATILIELFVDYDDDVSVMQLSSLIKPFGHILSWLQLHATGSIPGLILRYAGLKYLYVRVLNSSDKPWYFVISCHWKMKKKWWFHAVVHRYNAREYYEKNAELKQCIDEIASGFFSPEDPQLFRDLVNSLLNHDKWVSDLVCRWTLFDKIVF